MLKCFSARDPCCDKHKNGGQRLRVPKPHVAYCTAAGDLRMVTTSCNLLLSPSSAAAYTTKPHMSCCTALAARHAETMHETDLLPCNDAVVLSSKHKYDWLQHLTTLLQAFWMQSTPKSPAALRCTRTATATYACTCHHQHMHMLCTHGESPGLFVHHSM